VCTELAGINGAGESGLISCVNDGQLLPANGWGPEVPVQPRKWMDPVEPGDKILCTAKNWRGFYVRDTPILSVRKSVFQPHKILKTEW
jgi:hypothetical protein